MALKLSSPSFRPEGSIPNQHAAAGGDHSPALTWSNAPQETRALALIVEDPDARKPGFTHWVVYNIPATVTQLPQDTPHRGDLSDGTLQGQNDMGGLGYAGPKPPPGPPHRYVFHLYALDTTLRLEAGATRKQVEAAMRGHVLARAELVGLYGVS